MTRTTIPTRDAAPEAARPTLDRIQKMLGFIPNHYRLMATSPNVLNGWASLQASLAGTLDVRTRDAIALAVSDINECDYCQAAHSWISFHLDKIDASEIERNRRGQSADPKRAAAAAFARNLMRERGKVAEGDLAALRSVGYTDTNILEIIALAAQFMMTNLINNAFDTDVDFPAIPAQGTPGAAST
jgi:uncharacterized peroxidase-related enzyme